MRAWLVLSMLVLPACPAPAPAVSGQVPVQPAPAPSRAPNVCGTLPVPTATAVTPFTTSGDTAHAVLTPTGIVLTVTGNGSFQNQQVASTWAFSLAGDRLVSLGELAHETRADARVLLDGRGPVVVASAKGLEACGSAPLPALPPIGRGDRPPSYFLDDGTVLAVRYESVAVPGCQEHLARTTTVSRIHVDALQPGAATWRNLASRAIAPPAGAGCRATYPVGAEAWGAHAAIGLLRCTFVDATDSVAVDRCALQVESWQKGAWVSTEVPGLVESRDPFLVVSRDDGALVATTTNEKIHVYGTSPSLPVSPKNTLPGHALSMSGSRMLVASPGGKRVGTAGGAWRLQVHAFTKSAWKPATDTIDVDDVGHVAVVWDTDRVVVVAPEDKRDQNPLPARVLEARAGAWRELGTASALVTP